MTLKKENQRLRRQDALLPAVQINQLFESWLQLCMQNSQFRNRVRLLLNAHELPVIKAQRALKTGRIPAVKQPEKSPGPRA